MAWSQVQYTANTTHLTSGSTASTVINATSTPTSGNLLIALVWAYKFGGPAPTYSGLGSWVHIGQIYSASSGNVVGDIFYYVAGSSEPSTWTITSSNVQYYGAEFYEYSGNSATPLDVSSFVNAAGTLTPSTSLTLTNANELVVYGVVCTSTVTSLTLPTGFSSGHTDLGQNPAWGDGFKVFTSSGATGAQTATLVGSSVCAVMMVAFAPAATGTYNVGATVAGSAGVSDTSAMIANAATTIAGAAGVATSEAMTANVSATLVGTAALTDTGSIIANVSASISGSANITGTGTVTGGGVYNVSATVSGTAAITAALSASMQRTATIAGNAAISNIAAMIANAVASISGTGALSAIGSVAGPITVVDPENQFKVIYHVTDVKISLEKTQFQVPQKQTVFITGG